MVRVELTMARWTTETCALDCDQDSEKWRPSLRLSLRDGLVVNDRLLRRIDAMSLWSSVCPFLRFAKGFYGRSRSVRGVCVRHVQSNRAITRKSATVCEGFHR